MGRARRWSQDKEDWFRQIYPYHTNKAIGKMLGCSHRNVICHAVRLNVNKSPYFRIAQGLFPEQDDLIHFALKYAPGLLELQKAKVELQQLLYQKYNETLRSNQQLKDES